MTKHRFKTQTVNPRLKEISDRLAKALVNNLNANTAADAVMVKNKPVPQEEDLVLRAIRMAEKAHRNRAKGPHLRKAPDGQDRPNYLSISLK